LFLEDRLCGFNLTEHTIICPPPHTFVSTSFVCAKRANRLTEEPFFVASNIANIEGLDLVFRKKYRRPFLFPKKPVVFAIQCKDIPDIEAEGCQLDLSFLRL
jgi:hypothetical protein